MEYRRLLIAVFFVIFSAHGSSPSFFFPEDPEGQAPAPLALNMPVLQRNRTVDAAAQAFPGQGVQVKQAVVVVAVARQKQQEEQQPAPEAWQCVVN